MGQWQHTELSDRSISAVAAVHMSKLSKGTVPTLSKMAFGVKAWTKTMCGSVDLLWCSQEGYAEREPAYFKSLKAFYSVNSPFKSEFQYKIQCIKSYLPMGQVFFSKVFYYYLFNL